MNRIERIIGTHAIVGALTLVGCAGEASSAAVPQQTASVLESPDRESLESPPSESESPPPADGTLAEPPLESHVDPARSEAAEPTASRDGRNEAVTPPREVEPQSIPDTQERDTIRAKYPEEWEVSIPPGTGLDSLRQELDLRIERHCQLECNLRQNA